MKLCVAVLLCFVQLDLLNQLWCLQDIILKVNIEISYKGDLSSFYSFLGGAGETTRSFQLIAERGYFAHKGDKYICPEVSFEIFEFFDSHFWILGIFWK